MRKNLSLCFSACAAILSFPALAAEQCGPLQRLTAVDTVTGPAGFMLVPVKIGDSQRLLLFDTGGSLSGLTQAAAAELHLQTFESRTRLIGVNGAVSNRYTIIPSLSIGAAETKSAQYMILPNDMPALSQGGVAGTLAPAPGVDIELDFAAKKLSFYTTNHCEGRVVYWPADAVAVVPMRVAGNDPGGARIEHIVVPVTLDGKTIDAQIDTGTADNALNLRVARDRFGVDVNAPDVRQVGQLKYATDKVYRKRFSTLSFEGVTVTNPELTLVPDEMTRAMGDQRRTGALTRPADRGLPELILGMDLLRKLHVYIAYRERKLYVTAAADAAQLQQASASRPASAPAELTIAGSWKVAVKNGPVPVCELVQSAGELTGSCSGPAAKGEVTGTVAGQAIRWQWKRVANGNGATTLWNFSGTMTSGDAITGFVEQAGRSAPFTATKQ